MFNTPTRHPNMTSVVAATIASGGALSAELDLNGQIPTAIAMPAAWDAASLTLQVSVDDSATFLNVYDDDGTEYTLTVAASRYIFLNPLLLVGVRKLKIRSGTSGTPVNQTAERVLQIVTVPA